MARNDVPVEGYGTIVDSKNHKGETLLPRTAGDAVTITKGRFKDLNAREAIENVYEFINEVEGGALIFDTDINTTTTVGGISAGTDLDDLSVSDILRLMLYPHVDIEFEAHTSHNPTGMNFEPGMTVAVNKIIVNVTKLGSGAPYKVEYVRFDGENVETMIHSYLVEPTDTYFECDVLSTSPWDFRYDDNRGAGVYITDTEGGRSLVKCPKVQFSYPYYVGVSDITCSTSDDVTSLTKFIEGKSNKVKTFTTTNEQRPVFAYPIEYGELKSIVDGNNFNNILSFKKTIITVEGLAEMTHDYYVYQMINPATLDNFKFTFNH